MEEEAKTRIAMVLPDLRGGGAERVALRLGQEFARRGFAVDFVLAVARGELLEEAAQCGRIVNLAAPKLRQSVRPLVRYLREAKPAGVQVSMWPLTVYAIIAHRLARSKARLVLSDHNNLSISYAPKGRLHMRALGVSMRLIYPLADTRIAVSDGVAEDLAKLSGLARLRWLTVHNPVGAPDGVTAGAETDGLWRVAGARRLLSVGSFKKQKNFALLIEAFARLAGSRNVELAILGDGVLRPELEAAITRHGLEDRISLPGFVSPWPYFASADLYVMSSDYEGLPMVLIEALHFGLPIVSTDCRSGPREILEDGKLGALVPCGDAQALAKSINRALDSHPDLDRLKRRAADFALPAVADTYQALLLGS